MDNEQTFIYSLSCPDTKAVRYVGKSNNPKGRYARHLINSRGKTYHVCNWISSLLIQNKKPTLSIIETCLKTDWKERETYWIDYLKKAGNDLTNARSGGDGLDFTSQETRQKMSIKKIGNKNNSKFVFTDDHRARMSASAIKKFIDNPELKNAIRENQKKAVLKTRSLTEDQVREIKSMLSAGIKRRIVVEKTGVNERILDKIKQNKNYSWVK